MQPRPKLHPHQPRQLASRHTPCLFSDPFPTLPPLPPTPLLAMPAGHIGTLCRALSFLQGRANAGQLPAAAQQDRFHDPKTLAVRGSDGSAALRKKHPSQANPPAESGFQSPKADDEGGAGCTTNTPAMPDCAWKSLWQWKNQLEDAVGKSAWEMK